MKHNTIQLIAFLLSGLIMSTAAQASSMDKVKKHGAVRCGINENLPGFSENDNNGKWSGLDVDICRAVAAAVFSDASKVEYVPVSGKDRFESLASGKFDILSRNTTWNLSRDTGMNITFVGINYYDGQGFMLSKKSGIRSALGLDGSSICVEKATTHIENLKDYFQLNRMKYQLQEFDSAQEALSAYEGGKCQVITSDQSSLYSLRTQLKNPNDSKVLAEVISKVTPGACCCSQEMVPWPRLYAGACLSGMLDAEEAGITLENVDQVRQLSRDPAVRRLLGLEKNTGESLGLSKDWALITSSSRLVIMRIHLIEMSARAHLSRSSAG